MSCGSSESAFHERTHTGKRYGVIAVFRADVVENVGKGYSLRIGLTAFELKNSREFATALSAYTRSVDGHSCGFAAEVTLAVPLTPLSLEVAERIAELPLNGLIHLSVAVNAPSEVGVTTR